MFANLQRILRRNRPWSEVSDWYKLAEFGPRAQTQLLSYARPHCFWGRGFSPLHTSLELSPQPDPSYAGTQRLSPVIRAHRFAKRPLSRDPVWDTCPSVPHLVDTACRKPRSLSQLSHGVWRESCQGPDGCSGPAAPTLAGRPTHVKHKCHRHVKLPLETSCLSQKHPGLLCWGPAKSRPAEPTADVTTRHTTLAN